jgi:hypothetical protein
MERPKVLIHLAENFEILNMQAAATSELLSLIKL